MRNLFYIVLLLAMICGCSTRTSILPFGPETYKITADGWNLTNAKNDAIAQANIHCQKMNKHFMPVSAQGKSLAGGQGRGIYDLAFRCLDASDPELKRPDWQNSPDIIIESR